jgi:hypothetical protein
VDLRFGGRQMIEVRRKERIVRRTSSRLPETRADWVVHPTPGGRHVQIGFSDFQCAPLDMGRMPQHGESAG